ncbi:D-2-hydroxyacid dehydrogenase [Defluviitalea raffinosedens]|uniref:D-2-hydroxyacid dehydrogenase n=1 Tax=Defluviitalea raffinosedens TaxID=1450156 RepID=A0A7C8LQ51_9FIRM|nr:D-2-hydroxyacid dehydrogenase [Defluviitalea raffinosedens]KAE9634485.1 D-2-hydroxyacid dehydrogenase [Defluviitalea raffinosedens]
MKILSSINIGESNVELVKKKYHFIEYLMFKNIEEAGEHLEDAEVFVTFGFDTTAYLIEKMKNLKWIQSMSTGIDMLPFEKLKERNILLTNVTGIHGIPIAEYVMAVILNDRIDGFTHYEQQKNKIWKRKMEFEELYGKTIAILGTGTIGKEIARKAKAFDMYTIGVNTSGKPVDYFDKTLPICELNGALSQGDYIVDTLPLTDQTRRILGKEQFASMKSSAYFINIGRGATVDEEALIEALQNHIIRGATLDVFEKEPLSQTSPLWTMKNVYITPHISGLSNMYMNRAFPIFEHNLKTYLEGKEDYINKIDLDKKY